MCKALDAICFSQHAGDALIKRHCLFKKCVCHLVVIMGLCHITEPPEAVCLSQNIPDTTIKRYCLFVTLPCRLMIRACLRNAPETSDAVRLTQHVADTSMEYQRFLGACARSFLIGAASAIDPRPLIQFASPNLLRVFRW